MGIFNKFTSYLNKINSFENAVKMAPNRIGVYMFAHEGQVKYVGRAIEAVAGESPSGLKKKLQEHWRDDSSVNKEIYNLRDSVAVKIKVCATIKEAKNLEKKLVEKYDTVNNGWNLSYED